jgi:hypothetical protein
VIAHVLDTVGMVLFLSAYVFAGFLVVFAAIRSNR